MKLDGLNHVIFSVEADPDATIYEGPVALKLDGHESRLMSPTWRQAAAFADGVIELTKDFHHVFLEAGVLEGRLPREAWGMGAVTVHLEMGS